jgi:NAD-dependent deacetylase
MTEGAIERAAEVLAGARRVTVLTGAGISTDSGIPDFRGPNGVWTRNPAAERASNLDAYLSDPEVRRAAWRSRIDGGVLRAEPNDGHKALVELERQGRLVAIVTQNIDELHQRAGSDPGLVIEVHGTAHRTICWSCRDRRPMTEALERVRGGDEDPACERCGGILKSDTISFGQQLVPEVIDAAFTAAERCDVLLAIGSTLSVHPAAAVVPTAKRAGARVVILNAEPTAMDDQADALVRAPIGTVLPHLIGAQADQ